MSDQAVVQTSFVGGEWSPLAQGQIDNPNYHKSLALCSNGVPLEEGAWTRRSGTLHGGYTRRGKFSKSFSFPFGADAPYDAEITWDGSNSFITFWRVDQRVTDTTFTLDNANAPTGSPATFTCTTTINATLATGDDVLFSFPVTNNTLNGATLINRVFTITVTGTKTFTMVDAITGAAVNASSFTYDNTVTNTVSRITKFSAPYTSQNDVSITRVVTVYDGTPTNNVELVLLNQNHAPIVLTGTYTGATFATFTKTTASFLDGPYVLQETTGALTLGGASGTVSFSHTGGLINNGNGFTAADVGRSMRILSEPNAWNNATNYSAGAVVTLPSGFNFGVGSFPNPDSSYWTAQVANTGVRPDQNPTVWVPYTNGQNWTWATITTVGSTSSGTLTIQGPAVFNTSNITYWQMDYFNAQWGWPYAGCFAEGRLWLASVTGTEGRFDASAAGQATYFVFSPTDSYGTPGDGNAISYTIVDPNPSNIVWMAADPNGIIVGREHDEWTIRPSVAETPITPTSIRARRATGFGSGYLTDPVRCGSSLAFIDRTYRRLMEMVSDVFSNKLTGRNMNKLARHLGRGLYTRSAYQDSTVPIIWVIDTNSALFGCCYRRIGFYATQEPDMLGWHKHTLGSTWTVTDIVSTSNYSSNATLDQTVDAVSLTTFDGTYYHREVLQPLFDTENTAINGWFLDSAPAYVVGRDPALDSGSAEIQIYGLSHLNGKTVTAYIAGLDCGTYTVSSGVITVPYQSDPEGLLTAAYLIGLSGTYTYGCPIDVKSGGTRHQVTVPVVVGFKYLSEGQLLRPANGPDIMKVDGTGLGKFRKAVSYTAHLNNTGSCNFGTSSSNTLPADLRNPTPNGPLLTASQTFTGVAYGTLNDTYSFDGQLYWSSNSCYPMTLISCGAFLSTGSR